MPTSAYMGREFFTNHLFRVAGYLDTVIDVGPGEGTYSILGRHIAPNARWTAVEIFTPYVERYDLDQKYDEVVVEDARNFEFGLGNGLAIFGDVLEHMTERDAQDLLWYAAVRCDYLYVSVPIIPAPQGPSHGNDHEAHLHDWTFDDMTAFLLTLTPATWDAWRGYTVGRWWLDL